MPQPGRDRGRVANYCASAYHRAAITRCVTNQTTEIHRTNEERYVTFSDPARE